MGGENIKMKKSLNIKIPMSIVGQMIDSDEFNPEHITNFIMHYINCTGVKDSKCEGFTINYTFKIDSNYHKMIKQKALDEDLPITELVCRLFNKYY